MRNAIWLAPVVGMVVMAAVPAAGDDVPVNRAHG